MESAEYVKKYSWSSNDICLSASKTKFSDAENVDLILPALLDGQFKIVTCGIQFATPWSLISALISNFYRLTLIVCK